MAHQTSIPVIAELKSAYFAYRSALEVFDPDQVAKFLTPDCHQIFRPIPSFATDKRAQILEWLTEQRKGRNFQWAESRSAVLTAPLTPQQRVVGLDAVEREIGADMRTKAEGSEAWEGLRVELWDEVEGESADDEKKVVVNYWFKREAEGGQWLQCLHYILFIGRKVLAS